MTDRAQRFKELINALKTNQLKFTNAIGVKYSQTNAIYNGRKEFSRNYLHKISERYPNVNTHWILTGKGAMFLDHQFVTGHKKTHSKQMEWVRRKVQSGRGPVSSLKLQNLVGEPSPEYCNCRK